MNRDSDSGRYGTDWTQWSVEHMWHVLHNEDPDRTFRHADAWYAVMQACGRHRDRLFAFRDQLLNRWTGTAADVYVARLDMLITGLDQTTEAAYTTYRALHTMASAISVAREKMAPLYAQWQRLDSQEQDYQNQWWIAQVFSSDPVTAEQREALNQPAREVMRVASDAIFQSYVEMTPAPSLERFDGIGDSTRNLGSSTPPGATLEPPRIPALQSQRGLLPLPSVGDPVLTGGAGSTTNIPPWVSSSSGQSQVPPNLRNPPITPVLLPAVGQGQNVASSSTAGRAVTEAPVHTPKTSSAATATGRSVGQTWAPTAPVGMPTSAKRPASGGGIAGVNGGDRARQRRRLQAGEGGVFATDIARAVPAVLQPDPEPPPTDPGPAIGLNQ